MPLTKPDLWRRLEAHAFDAKTGTAPFSVKLAFVENWIDDYTARTIEEYRKYLYLTQVSPTQVTPSLPIDRTWHMHLTYTKNYWDDLCGKVIGRPIHHNPCEGEEEMARYLDQYQATKALYEREFDSPPPEDIWPDAATDDPLDPKPFRGMAILIIAGILGGAGFVLRALGVVAIPMIIPIAMIIGVIVVSIVRDQRNQPKHRRPKKDGDGGGESWYGFEYSRRGGGDGDGDGDSGCGD